MSPSSNSTNLFSSSNPSITTAIGKKGMGMYPNGLRVLRDISPELFREVKQAGYPYKYRRWERHDGTEVAVAEENVLSDRDDSLQTIGIRRWRLQRVLQDAARKAGIPIHFAKRTESVYSLPDGTVEIVFTDGSKRTAYIVFGADGSKSAVRNSVADCGAKLQYTGTTCLMGISADTPSQTRGISLPSSSTSHCHGAFFPVGEDEQCFQFHFPVAAQDADEGNWGTLSQEVGREECRKLAERLKREGWHEKYLEPLSNLSVAVRIGFRLLDKPLKKIVYGHRGRIVLLGDAARKCHSYGNMPPLDSLLIIIYIRLLMVAFISLFNIHHRPTCALSGTRSANGNRRRRSNCHPP